jgi:hypothetical protein
MIDGPSRLYKYEAFTTRTLQNIKDQILYFGAPAGFNDPYDCAVTPNIPVPTDNEVRLWQDSFDRRHDPLPPVMKEWREKTSMDDMREMMLRNVRSVITEKLKEVINTRGVACFSETPSDLLMWSHYGGRYRGLCLEYDTAHDPFNRAQPVEYVDCLPVLSVGEFLGLDDDAESKSSAFAAKLFRTKSSSWKYEREWRVLHMVAGTQYVYQAPALTGVYFGPDIDFTSVEIVCLILKGQNPDVRFFGGRRSQTEFKVEFEPFTYTDFATANREGRKAEGDHSQVWPLPSKAPPRGGGRGA